MAWVGKHLTKRHQQIRSSKTKDRGFIQLSRLSVDSSIFQQFYTAEDNRDGKEDATMCGSNIV